MANAQAAGSVASKEPPAAATEVIYCDGVQFVVVRHGQTVSFAALLTLLVAVETNYIIVLPACVLPYCRTRNFLPSVVM
jgi:hypothetical protein